MRLADREGGFLLYKWLDFFLSLFFLFPYLSIDSNRCGDKLFL